MIEELFYEIEKALENDMYIAALSLSLMIPDIFGKVVYPELGNKKERYTRWINDINKELVKKYEFNDPLFDAGLIYKIRCSIIHELNPDLSDEDKQKESIEYFELTWRPHKSKSLDSQMQCKLIEDETGTKQIDKKYSISINLFCETMLGYAKDYYKDNKDKFQDLELKEITSYSIFTMEQLHIKFLKA